MAKPQNRDKLNKFTLNIPPHELVRWVRNEIRAENIHLNFYESAWKEYSFEEDYDPKSFEVEAQENLTLVSVEAILDIEPLVEQNYWILQLKVTDQIGLRPNHDDQPFESGSLTLDDFEKEFLTPDRVNAEITLFTETMEAKEHFDDWFDILKSEHNPATTH